MTDLDQRFHEYFVRLVPERGKAPSEAGEIVRAMTRIAYRNFNDGDHIGLGYGKETCNAAARYLQAHVGGDAREIIDDMWGMQSDRIYNAAVATLQQVVLDFLEKHPELEQKANEEDMWDYLIESEDRDYPEEDDDEDDDEW